MSAQASAPAAAPVRIGCSGWIYQHWRGLFYPEKLAVKRWFEFYASEFDTVGMKRTPFMMRKRCAPWYGRRCGDLRTIHEQSDCDPASLAPRRLRDRPVAIGETVRVGALTATPRRLVEDSRCPLTVQCVQAGRVVVSTQITGPGGTETVPLVLGEPYPVQGATVTLVSARPEKWNERRRPHGEYRFVFEGG